jgi:hypothetical protein
MPVSIPRNAYALLVLVVSLASVPLAATRSASTDAEPGDGEPTTLYAETQPLTQIQVVPERGPETFVASIPNPQPEP